MTRIFINRYYKQKSNRTIHIPAILTKIQRKVLHGDFEFSYHCLLELADEDFMPSDAITAILNAKEFDKLTENESHVRYAFYGFASDGRAMKIIVFVSQGKVFIKTIHEYFYE